jgi:hypothetical protein
VLLASFPSPSRSVWDIGPIPIRAYALCIIVGIVVAVLWGERRLVARGGKPGTVIDVAVWAVPFGLVGGRLYHVATDWQTYFGPGGNPIDALKVWQGGLGIWGAIALGGVGALIGCRRAGGGLAGDVFTSNLRLGIELAEEQRPDVVVFDGSGASIPPVSVDGRVLVVGPGQDATAYLNPYRVFVSDLVLLMGGGATAPIRELKEVPVIPVELRLRPVTPLAGRRVAVFTAGPAPVDHLDAEVVHVSRSLGDRAALREELKGIDADAFLVEIKAAAIDVVAEAAVERGIECVFAANDVRPLDPGVDLDAELLSLSREPVVG